MTSLHSYTASEDTSRSFLSSRGILKFTMTCSCGTVMDSIPCPETKSADLFIWKCPTCKKFKNIRSDIILSRKKISPKSFLLLVFYLLVLYFSIRSLTNLGVAALTGISDKTVGEWRKTLLNAVETWLFLNSTPLCAPGNIVEVDEAKFSKRKFNRGAYREGEWVLLIEKLASASFFLAPTLVPLIKSLVLPERSCIQTNGVQTTHNIPHTAYHIQHNTYNTQHTTHNITHTTHNIQHTTYNTQHTTCNTQHTTYSTQHNTYTAYNIQHTTYNTQHTTHNIQHTTYNIQHTT